MKKTKEVVSLMQEAVWRMKENTYEETKHLNAQEFFRYIYGKCRRTGFGGKRRTVVSARSC